MSNARGIITEFIKDGLNNNELVTIIYVEGQNPIKGLGLVMDYSDIRKITCEKQIVNSTEREGIDLQISIGH